METLSPTPETAAIQTERNKFKRLIYWLGDKFNSFDCSVDYWLTQKSGRFFSNPSVASFMNDVETRVEEQRATHGPNKIDKWIDERLNRFMSTPFMVSLANDFDNAADEAYDKRIRKINNWATKHGKEPVV